MADGQDRRQPLERDRPQHPRHGSDLPAHVVGQLRAVPASDVQALVGLEQPADIADLDEPLVPLGIDDDDAGRGHD